MIIEALKKFPKDTILKALENNWLVERELNNIVNTCYSIEIDKVNKEYEKILENGPKEPKIENLKSRVKYISEIQKYMDNCDKCSKKLKKLYEEQKKYYNQISD